MCQREKNFYIVEKWMRRHDLPKWFLEFDPCRKAIFLAIDCLKHPDDTEAVDIVLAGICEKIYRDQDKIVEAISRKRIIEVLREKQG